MNYSHFIAEKQNKVPQASFLLLFSLQKVPPHPQSPKERKEEKKKGFLSRLLRNCPITLVLRCDLL